jgi:single-strand DNA-binding protein
MSYTPSGKAITKFSMAIDQAKGQKPLWLDITCWNDLAERMNHYLYKGAQVFVQGRLQKNTYTDKDQVERTTVEIVAANIQLLDKRVDSVEAQEAPGED